MQLTVDLYIPSLLFNSFTKFRFHAIQAAGITLYFVLVAVALFVPSSGYFIENYGGMYN
jgi:predicted permease